MNLALGRGEDAKNQLRFSRFVHCVENDSGVCLYNAATLRRVFGNSALADFYRHLRAREEVPQSCLGSPVIDALHSQGILMSTPEDDVKTIGRVRDDAISSRRLDNIFVFLTEECNFKCEYCYVRHNSASKDGPIRMTSDIAERVIGFTRALTESHSLEKMYVIFYGGEPLLNWPILQKIVCGLEDDKSAARCQFLFRVITNGSLLRKHHVEFFRRHDIVPTISIDGAGGANNSMRDRPGNLQSVEDCALNLLASLGVPFELSVTANRLNVRTLPEHMRKLLAAYTPCSVRVNVPEAYAGFDRDAFLNLSTELSEVWNATFDVIRERRVPMSNSGRDFFLQARPQYYPCSGAMRRLAISPAGEIGQCESFLTQRKHLLGTVWDKPEDLSSDEKAMWTSRTAYDMPACQECIALGLCGGGCAYNAEMLTGDFFSPDQSICAVARAAVTAFIEEAISSACGKSPNAVATHGATEEEM